MIRGTRHPLLLAVLLGCSIIKKIIECINHPIIHVRLEVSFCEKVRKETIVMTTQCHSITYICFFVILLAKIFTYT
jgi:hypothetical protein